MLNRFTKAWCPLFAAAILGVGISAGAANNGNKGKNGKDAAPAAAPTATGLPQPGKVTELPIDTKMFKTAREYFAKPVQQKVCRGFKSKEYADWTANTLTPEQCAGYTDPQSAVLYVPAAYDGSETYGVYVHISPSDGGQKPSRDWQAVFDKLKLICVSPNKTSNNVTMLRRVVLGLDALATVKAKYKTNPDRIYVGGLSGGGHMAMLSEMMYPEIYQGVISHAAQSYLMSHFPGLTLADAKLSPRTKRKWVVISGDKDKNYAEIKKTSKDWEHAKFQYKFIDVPGMKHENASAEAFEEALRWIGAGGIPQCSGFV